MKEKNIAEELVNQSLKVIDCLEGKAKVEDVVTFTGSHAVDTNCLKERIENFGKPQEVKAEAKEEKKQEPKMNRALGSGSIKNKIL